MARKPPQPLLPFMRDPAPVPAEAPGPVGDIPSHPEGGRHALQDDSPRTPATADAAEQAASQGSDAAGGDGALRLGAEGPPRNVEGDPFAGAAGQRPEPTLKR